MEKLVFELSSRPANETNETPQGPWEWGNARDERHRGSLYRKGGRLGQERLCTQG